jgi:drug/metabolite transporter (DMT)-like permease
MSSFDLTLVLVSALLHALWNLQAKGSASPLAFMVGLQLVSAVVLAPLLLFVDFAEVPRAVWAMLAATAVAHAFYQYWLAMSYRHGELSVVYPISRSTPAFVPLVAVPLFGEPISPAGAAGIALVVFGMWLVQLDGRFRGRDLFAPGTGFAFLTLLATVAYSLADKRAMALLAGAGWSGPLPRPVFYYVLLVLAPTPLLLLLARRSLAPAELRELVRGRPGTVASGAIAGFASYALILQALGASSVSYVVAARQMSVVFAVGLAALWLGERPARARWLGALATVAGVAAIALFG